MPNISSAQQRPTLIDSSRWPCRSCNKRWMSAQLGPEPRLFASVTATRRGGCSACPFSSSTYVSNATWACELHSITQGVRVGG